MKIASIADIHGRDFWKELDHEKYDKVVFNGDYLDSYFYEDDKILSNFEEIIEFKKAYPDKVVLLLGNHDIPYRYSYQEYPCSGHRPEMYDALHQLFVFNHERFQVAFQVKNYIWTHAGIGQFWFQKNRERIEAVMLEFTTDIAGALNIIMKSLDREILFWCGKMRGGDDPHGGIVWADRRETKDWYLEDHHQIVGHTPINVITRYGNEEGSITYTDVLGKVAEIRDLQAAEIKKWGSVSDDSRYIEPTKFYEIEL